MHKQSSLPVDEPVPVKTSRSPPRRKESNVVHVMNLVRPFTLNQLKELLGKYGTLVADGPVRVRRFPHDILRNLEEQHPDLSHALLGGIAQGLAGKVRRDNG